jgi:two-component sensor histidine kinase
MSGRAEAVSLRRRLVVLAVALTVPLLVMTALLAWYDSRGALREAQRHDRQEIALMAARPREAVQRLRQGVAAIARALAPASPLDTAGGCPRFLVAVAALLGRDAIGLTVFDATGHPICAAPSPAIATLADPTPGFAMSLAGATASRPGFVLARLPLHPAGTLAAALAPGWLTPETIADAPAAWLQDAAGHGLATPPMPALQPDGRCGRAADCYATMPRGGGLRLLVASRQVAAVAAAQQLLYRWLAICALLLLGLLGFLLGLQRLLFHPLRRLGAEVGNWQGTSHIDPHRLLDAPREIAEVWRGFAETAEALRQRERDLRAAVIEQSLLLQETHHRVKNNLQIVTSLLSLQAARIRQPEARAVLEATHGRIHALSTLHRHLYSGIGMREIDMREILQEICGQIFDSLGETMGGRLALAIDAPAIRISSDEAVSLALIVSEIVTNAVKYAFPDGRAGRITVALTLACAQLHLRIDDDGIGLGKAWHWAACRRNAGDGDGIGLQLVRGFVRQLGGELTMTQVGGTRFDLLLDLHAPRAPHTPVSPPDFIERTPDHAD